MKPRCHPLALKDGQAGQLCPRAEARAARPALGIGVRCSSTSSASLGFRPDPERDRHIAVRLPSLGLLPFGRELQRNGEGFGHVAKLGPRCFPSTSRRTKCPATTGSLLLFRVCSGNAAERDRYRQQNSGEVGLRVQHRLSVQARGKSMSMCIPSQSQSTISWETLGPPADDAQQLKGNTTNCKDRPAPDLDKLLRHV